MKRIIIGGDHASPELKSEVIAHLIKKGYAVENVGTDTPDSCDYPVFAHKLCTKLLAGEADLGILICGTGVGISIAANKHDGIRAACCSDTFSARLTRIHNDANVLCFGARVVGPGLALDLVDAFVETEFCGEARHQKRIDLITAIEQGKLD